MRSENGHYVLLTIQSHNADGGLNKERKWRAIVKDLEEDTPYRFQLVAHCKDGSVKSTYAEGKTDMHQIPKLKIVDLKRSARRETSVEVVS